MKPIHGGVLVKLNNKREMLMEQRYLLFTEKSEYYAVALESGNIGRGKSERDAITDLLVLIEDDLLYRATEKHVVTTVPAQEKYQKAFIALHTAKNLKPPKISVSDLNAVAKKLKPLLNPKKPANYSLHQQVA